MKTARRASTIAASLLFAAACGAATVTPSPSPQPSAPPSALPSGTPIPSPSASPSPSPSGTPIPLPNAAQVAAAGSGVVWMLVADTHLFRSTDRGTSWTERTLPPSAGVTTIAFVDEREGWILATGSPATQCQSQATAIWHTGDGAASWQDLAASGIADPLCKGALAFSDAQRGYVTAWSPNSRPLIYRTGDGGKTWSASAPLPDPAGFTTQPGGVTLRPGPVSDFGARQLVYATGQAGGRQQGYVFASTNGGATWTPTNGTAPPEGVVIVTPTRWLQIGAPGSSQETTDGGLSWHAYATDYRQAAPIAPQVVFGDAETGYATVRGALSRTTDGGLHWTNLRTPGT